MCNYKFNSRDPDRPVLSSRSRSLIDITPIYAFKITAPNLFEYVLDSPVDDDPAFNLIIKALRCGSKTVPIPVEYIDAILDRNVDVTLTQPSQVAYFRVESYNRTEPLVDIFMSYLLAKSYFTLRDLTFVGSSTTKYATCWFKSDRERIYVRVFRKGRQYTMAVFPTHSTSVSISSFDRPTVLLTDGIRLTHSRKNDDIKIVEADQYFHVPDKPGRVEALLTADHTECVEFPNNSDSNVGPDEFDSLWEYWVAELRSMPLTGTDGVSIYRCEKNRAYCFYLAEGSIRYMLIKRSKEGSISLIKISPNRGLIPAIAQFLSKILFKNIK